MTLETPRLHYTEYGPCACEYGRRGRAHLPVLVWRLVRLPAPPKKHGQILALPPLARENTVYVLAMYQTAGGHAQVPADNSCGRVETTLQQCGQHFVPTAFS